MASQISAPSQVWSSLMNLERLPIGMVAHDNALFACADNDSCADW